MWSSWRSVGREIWGGPLACCSSTVCHWRRKPRSYRETVPEIHLWVPLNLWIKQSSKPTLQILNIYETKSHNSHFLSSKLDFLCILCNKINMFFWIVSSMEKAITTCFKWVPYLFYLAIAICKVFSLNCASEHFLAILKKKEKKIWLYFWNFKVLQVFISQIFFSLNSFYYYSELPWNKNKVKK